MSPWVRSVTNRRAGICFLRPAEVPPCLTEVPQPTETTSMRSSVKCGVGGALEKISGKSNSLLTKEALLVEHTLPTFRGDSYLQGGNSLGKLEESWWKVPAIFYSSFGLKQLGTKKSPKIYLGKPALVHLAETEWLIELGLESLL